MDDDEDNENVERDEVEIGDSRASISPFLNVFAVPPTNLSVDKKLLEQINPSEVITISSVFIFIDFIDFDFRPTTTNRASNLSYRPSAT
jgi:hypothetical protein